MKTDILNMEIKNAGSVELGVFPDPL